MIFIIIDVYKRQDIQSFDIPRLVTVYPDRAGVRWWTKAWFNNREEGETVSYTHLDVYKRQAPEFYGECFGGPPRPYLKLGVDTPRDMAKIGRAHV